MDNSYNAILARCLARVPAGIDKRKGSVIYDALAPAAAELAQAYIALATLQDNYAFPDTMQGENLTRKVTERGIVRESATAAVRQAIFKNSLGGNMDVPVGTRFSGGALNFVVIEKISLGVFRVRCETPGTEGNQYYGTLLPIDYVQSLGTADLADVLIPGEDAESDAELWARYKDSLDGAAYGGNIKDYEQRVNAIAGVGGVRVYPIWQGGGSVKLVIIASDWAVPSAELVDLVQTQIDPEGNQGQGVGIAPIGHTVTVVPVAAVTANITTEIVWQSGYSWASSQTEIETVLNDYFAELAQFWAQVDNIVVRISQIETRILALDGVLDISGTKINGTAENLVLTPDEIPELGTVGE